MTAHEMNLKALGLMGEDSSDTALLTEYNTALLIGYNAAYRDIVANHLMVEIWKDVTLGTDKTYELASITYGVNEIVAVAQYRDFTEASGYKEGKRYGFAVINGTTLIVPQADAEGTVYVLYKPIPADLTNATPTTGAGATSPLYVQSQHQIALIYKGISELRFSQGLVDDGILWNRRYSEAAYAIRQPVKQTTISSYFSI